ncbi:IS200/IS605 family transposase [Neolewinella litorea]|uniref:IS200/IS605 family transposase n=1 Tax=Neolewinella litorea TaxID=2562452 RepID=A0A4S4NW72_9BACT|nr:IS200/IS605 family transposase [Neolewinella litorea]THH40520.1 IS200/IS605 family transposase [Neolewinella litorea]
MPQSYLRIVLHTVFSTKYRRPTIHPRVEQELYSYLSRRLQLMGCRVYAIGGTLDHVHIVHGLPRTISIAKVLEDIKSQSSRWMGKNGYPDFWWQNGYGCHSVDYRKVDGIIRYVERQKEHHYGSQENYRMTARLTFEAEMLKFLREFDLDYDPQYLFPSEPKSNCQDHLGPEGTQTRKLGE